MIIHVMADLAGSPQLPSIHIPLLPHPPFSYRHGNRRIIVAIETSTPPMFPYILPPLLPKLHCSYCWDIYPPPFTSVLHLPWSPHVYCSCHQDISSPSLSPIIFPPILSSRNNPMTAAFDDATYQYLPTTSNTTTFLVTLLLLPQKLLNPSPDSSSHDFGHITTSFLL